MHTELKTNSMHYCHMFIADDYTLCRKLHTWMGKNGKDLTEIITIEEKIKMVYY